MFEMFLSSARLLLQGKLFRDNTAVLRLWAGGFVTALVLIGLLASLVNIWAGALIGGLAGGALMPHLFRNLKYN